MKYSLSSIATEEIYESLANSLNVTKSDIARFLQKNKHRVNIDGYNYDYDPLEVEDILVFFNLKIDDLKLNAITVSHVAAILDDQSYLKYGMLSLNDLFSTTNSFVDFLKEFGVTFKETNGFFNLYVNDRPQSTEYTINRTTEDRCINGFMFDIDAESDGSISRLLRAPELVVHIGRELLKSEELEKEWIKRSVPSVICFSVNIEELDDSTFKYNQYYTQNLSTKSAYFVLKYFEDLLFKETGYPPRNPMVHLKEKVSITADRLIQIRPAITKRN